MANDINIVVSAQVGDATKGLQQVQQQVQRVDRQITRSTKALKANANQFNSTAVATNKFAKGALQQAGYQIGDFAVQVSGGQNALQAFGQQGSQLLGIFGPIGAVLGAGVAIFAAVGTAMQRAGKAAGEAEEEVSSLSAAFSKLESINAIRSAENLSLPAQAAAREYSALLDAMQAVAMEQRATAISGLLGDLGPLEKIADLKDELDEINELIQLNNDSFGDNEAALDTLRGLQSDLIRQINSEVDVRGLILSAQGKTREEAARNLETTIASLDAMGRLTPELRAQLVAYGEQAGLLGVIESEVEAVSENTQEAAEQSKTFADEMQRAANAVMGINTTAFSKLQQLQAELRGRTRGLGDNEIRVMQAARAAEIAAQEAGVDSALELAAISAEAAKIERQIIAAENGLSKFNNTATTSTVAVKKIAKAVSVDLTPAMKQAVAVGDMVGNSMEGALMAIVDGTSSVKDAFKSMASEIIKELYRIFVVKKITGMIADAVSFVSGPKTGNTGTLGLPSFSGGGYTGGGSRSGGLDGKGGYMAMVHPRETVVDHTKGQSSGGGVVVNQTINVSTGVQQTVRTEIKTLMPQIADAAKSAVADAKLRGGSYGRSFA